MINNSNNNDAGYRNLAAEVLTQGVKTWLGIKERLRDETDEKRIEKLNTELETNESFLLTKSIWHEWLGIDPETFFKNLIQREDTAREFLSFRHITNSWLSEGDIISANYTPKELPPIEPTQLRGKARKLCANK